MALDEYFFPQGSAGYMNYEASNPGIDLNSLGNTNAYYFNAVPGFNNTDSYNPGTYNPGAYAGAFQTDLGPNAGNAYNPALNDLSPASAVPPQMGSNTFQLGRATPNADGSAPTITVSNNGSAPSTNLYDPATEEYFNSNLRMSPNPNVYGTTNDPYSAEMPAGNFGAAVNNGISNNAGSWLENLYNSYLGPNTALGGRSGAFTGGGSGGMGAGGQGWLPALMSIGSGIYGMTQANEQRRLAQQAIAGSSPWTSSGGAAGAGTALTNVIQGDFTNDPGYKAALQAAARTSSQQPGGFAAMAAAQAALKYQNDRIQALGPAAGVGFSPGAGYQTALGGMTSANDLASRSLGSIGYGVTGTQPMPPWLQKYLIDNNMGGR